MTFAPPNLTGTLEPQPGMPAWIRGARLETLEDAAFSSGAVLSHLHLVLGREAVPQALLRDRLALRAAEACVAYSGRPERAAELRDAIHLLRPGDLRPSPNLRHFLACLPRDSPRRALSHRPDSPARGRVREQLRPRGVEVISAPAKKCKKVGCE